MIFCARFHRQKSPWIQIKDILLLDDEEINNKFRTIVNHYHERLLPLVIIWIGSYCIYMVFRVVYSMSWHTHISSLDHSDHLIGEDETDQTKEDKCADAAEGVVYLMATSKLPHRKEGKYTNRT